MYQDNICLFTIKLQNGTILENCRIHRETKNIIAQGGMGQPYKLNFTDHIIHIYDENGEELSTEDIISCEIVRGYLNKNYDDSIGGTQNE